MISLGHFTEPIEPFIFFSCVITSVLLSDYYFFRVGWVIINFAGVGLGLGCEIPINFSPPYRFSPPNRCFIYLSCFLPLKRRRFNFISLTILRSISFVLRPLRCPSNFILDETILLGSWLYLIILLFRLHLQYFLDHFCFRAIILATYLMALVGQCCRYWELILRVLCKAPFSSYRFSGDSLEVR
jgi:hypothetical protein